MDSLSLSCIVDETFPVMWLMALSTDVGVSANSVDAQLLRFWVGLPNSSCVAAAAACGLYCSSRISCQILALIDSSFSSNSDVSSARIDSRILASRRASFSALLEVRSCTATRSLEIHTSREQKTQRPVSVHGVPYCPTLS